MEPAGRVVLVVEDDVAVLETLADCLAEGFTVLTASSVDEALRVVRSSSLSAAIVDLNLPRGSGRDVVAAIAAPTPVIIFSGLPDESSGLEATRPNTFLVPKPSSPTLLRRMLEQAIADVQSQPGYRD
jgi:DNA-binding response OmpR family regulator